MKLRSGLTYATRIYMYAILTVKNETAYIHLIVYQYTVYAHGIWEVNLCTDHMKLALCVKFGCDIC